MDNNKRKEIRCPIRNDLINPNLGHTTCICVHTHLCVYMAAVRNLTQQCGQFCLLALLLPHKEGNKSEGVFGGFPPASACEQLCVFCFYKSSHGKIMLIDLKQDNWSNSMEDCCCQRDNWSFNTVNQSAESVREVWGFRTISTRLLTQ